VDRGVRFSRCQRLRWGGHLVFERGRVLQLNFVFGRVRTFCLGFKK